MKLRRREDTSSVMKRAGALVLMVFVGCFQPPTEQQPPPWPPLVSDAGPTDAGALPDAGPPDAGPPMRCQTFDRYAVTYCSEVPTKVICQGVECALGQECCLTTGACVEMSDAGACPVLPTTWPDQPPPQACSTNSQCGEGFFCMPDDLSCGGPSHCQRIEHCGFCEPAGGPQCQVCGCNGVTYPSDQHACIAGVTTIGRGACGEGPCATDAQCPSGSFCCLSAGSCTPRAEAWRCGQGLNCSECVFTGHGGGPGGSEGVFCRHAGCGNARGICTLPSSMNCGGAVNTVCGCDGVSYVNECWATAAGTNVASMGACP